MSGKSYTMKEMKAIVDYLTEHRAYGEIKGRKMWVDYANSKLTTRTWQSLRETFLKRILPDITNPYYKLTLQQITSFRNGIDLGAQINNKLEIQTIDDDSSSDTHKKDSHIEPPSNSNNTKGGNDAGEDILSSKITENRSSTETVLIGRCYNTAEEIQKDLESPSRENENKDSSPIPCSTKSIRDYITYSEPLTPMLQEVLHDFASEDEGDEPPMQIVEYPEPCIRNEISPIEILDTENNDSENRTNEITDNNTKKDESTNKESAEKNINENVGPKSDLTDRIDKSVDAICIDDSEKVTEITSDKNIEPGATDNATNNISINNNEKSIPLTKSQNNSNCTTDTLPNNQEAFKELDNAIKNSSDKSDKNLVLDESVNKTRKRSKSQEFNSLIPKKRLCTDKTLQQNLFAADATSRNKNICSKSSPTISKTQLQGHDDYEDVAKIYNNSVNLDNANNGISEKQENYQNCTENGESVCISDDSISKEQLPQNVLIKTDEDKDSVTSHKKESSRILKANTGSTSKDTLRTHNENPDYMKEVINEVVVLKSRSVSTSDHVVATPKKSKASLRAVHKMHRDRALANVFGYSSGIKSNRRKHKKNVKRLSSHHRNINSSSSNEWTSDTGSEFVSPPRGRKNRHTKKYLKPKSARIMSLEEEGGLFVMYGKKIYPVVKDGKLIKNYLTYTPDNDSEDEESYWKLKYVEEKKKTDKLTELLKINKTSESVPVESRETHIVHTNACEKPSTVTEPPKETIDKNVVSVVKEPEKKEEAPEPKTVKIKFMKNNEEVQLEGHWSHIHPVLEQVVQILHKEPEPKPKPLPEKKSLEREHTNQVHQSVIQMAGQKRKVSRDSTPVSTIHLDEDVQEKIDKLEEEIFKEIEEREIAESSPDHIHVTKRKVGRPRLASSTANKADNIPEPSKKKPSLRPADVESNDSSVVVMRRRTRTPKKANDREPVETVTSDVKRKTRNSSRNAALEEEDSSIKYKLASPQHAERTAADNKYKSVTRTANKQTSKRRYPIKTARIFSSPDNISINSIDSTQGYQDSDASNLSICLRKKRKLRVTVLNRARGKTQRALKRKTQQYTHEDMSSDSNVSFVTAPLKSSTHQSSSMNTEVYTSESYQMLFPQRSKSNQQLDKIEETSPAIYNKEDNDAPSDLVAEKSSVFVNENASLSPGFLNYGENSSHVTLPPSPVLSIVEKISISKNELDNTKDIDVPDDSTREEVKQTMLNEYMLLDVDMSVPLMEQECGLQKSSHDTMDCHFNSNVPEISLQLSDSLLSKVCAVNIAEPTLSESIHQKLKNLVLESAKKIAKQMNEHSDKDKETAMEICELETQRVKRAKKRCSTPRKRQKKEDLKVDNIEPHVEEEHTEFYGNEQSRPLPALIVTDGSEINDNVVTTDTNNDRRRSDRLRKKKDVIKVKILKPKQKKKECNTECILQKESKTSIQMDSGINDTESGVFLQGFDHSVELIHNHSDTCLQAHECIGDSVEIINDNAISVVSLNSNSPPVNKTKCVSLTALNEDKLLDICCENAQDAANLSTATELLKLTSIEKRSVFKNCGDNFSPVNSLLTDDLSDECPPPNNIAQNRMTKWYLLSEDEASNTNNVDIVTKISNGNTGYGANLQDIFPITCAVPDLSTITEENTTKFLIDGNIRTDYDSQSLPNV